MKQWKLPILAAAFVILVPSADFAQKPLPRHLLTVGFYFVEPCDIWRDWSAPMQIAGRPEAGRYCFERWDVVNQTGVASVVLETDARGGRVVKLILHEDAAQQLRVASERRIGSQIGAVLNGQLVSVATIAAPSLSVSIGGLSQQAAGLVIQAFRRGLVAAKVPALLPREVVPRNAEDMIPHLVVCVTRIEHYSA